MPPRRKRDVTHKLSKQADNETSTIKNLSSSLASGRKRKNCEDEPTTIDALPDETLVLMFEYVGFPDRYAAAQVCKRWLRAAYDRKFCLDVGQFGSLNEAIQKARPGDLLDVPANMYQESILIDKPLKLVGSAVNNRAYAAQRRPVVLCANHPPVVLCNAKCCFVNFMFRANAARHESSIVSLGPSCEYVRLERCDLAGLTGLHVPALNSPNTQLIMLGCNVYGTRANLAAIMVMSGYLEMVGCNVHSNSIGIELGPGAAAEIRDCDITFNDMALALDGSAVLHRNNLWGNGELGCNAIKERMKMALHLQALRPQPSTPGGFGQAVAKRRATPRPLRQVQEPALGPRAKRRVVRRSLSGCRRGSTDNIEVEACSLRPVFLNNTSELQKRIRKQIRALVKGVYPAPDVDPDNPLEILAQSDLDSDEEDGEDSADDNEWQAGELDDEESEDEVDDEDNVEDAMDGSEDEESDEDEDDDSGDDQDGNSGEDSSEDEGPDIVESEDEGADSAGDDDLAGEVSEGEDAGGPAGGSSFRASSAGDSAEVVAEGGRAGGSAWLGRLGGEETASDSEDEDYDGR